MVMHDVVWCGVVWCVFRCAAHMPGTCDAPAVVVNDALRRALLHAAALLLQSADAVENLHARRAEGVVAVGARARVHGGEHRLASVSESRKNGFYLRTEPIVWCSKITAPPMSMVPRM